MNVCHVHSTEPGPGPSSVLSGRNEEEEMEEGTESESAETEATESEDEDVERNSEEDGLNTERVRKTTERQEEQQPDVEVFEREEGHLTDDPGFWPADLTDQDREKIVRKSSAQFFPYCTCQLSCCSSFTNMVMIVENTIKMHNCM